MAFLVKTLTIPSKVWDNAIKASQQMFGTINFSGYVQALIQEDCKKRKIKTDD